MWNVQCSALARRVALTGDKVHYSDPHALAPIWWLFFCFGDRHLLALQHEHRTHGENYPSALQNAKRSNESTKVPTHGERGGASLGSNRAICCSCVTRSRRKSDYPHPIRQTLHRWDSGPEAINISPSSRSPFASFIHLIKCNGTSRLSTL